MRTATTFEVRGAGPPARRFDMPGARASFAPWHAAALLPQIFAGSGGGVNSGLRQDLHRRSRADRRARSPGRIAARARHLLASWAPLGLGLASRVGTTGLVLLAQTVVLGVAACTVARTRLAVRPRARSTTHGHDHSTERHAREACCLRKLPHDFSLEQASRPRRAAAISARSWRILGRSVNAGLRRGGHSWRWLGAAALGLCCTLSC
jgi:hypothetical protein